MIRLLSAVLLLLLSALPAQAGVLFISGFETGDMREWTNLGMATGQGNVRSGAWAANGSSATLAKTSTGFGATTLFLRFGFRPTGTWNAKQVVVQCDNAADSLDVLIYITSANTLAWSHNDGAPITTGTTVLAGSTYVLIEAKMVISATVGGVELKINGAVEFTSLGTNTSDVSAFDHCYIGPASSVASSPTADETFDDVLITTTGYPGTGRNIARQGASNTPTDSWTKVGCTNIQDCWSQTPFDATKAATDAVLNDAQTTLVHGFSTTQTGHGTEVIAVHDTINACKTALVGKIAIAGNMAIRRQGDGGSVVDTTVAMTTSDGYHDDGIWTDTNAHLDVMEHGAKSLGTNLATVEDMWTICDFTAVSAAIRHRVTQ